MTYNLVRGWAPLRGVIAGRSKYVDLPIPELYDLSADPKEASNLARGQRAIASRSSTNLLRTYNVDPPNRPGRESAEAAAALKSLGYVQGSAPARAVLHGGGRSQAARRDRSRSAHGDDADAGRPAAQEAIAMLHSVIARRPDTADAYISLAHAYWEGGQPQLAIATLEHALASGAPDRDVRIRLGHLSRREPCRQRARDRAARGPVGGRRRGAERAGRGLWRRRALRRTRSRTFKKVLALDATNGLAYQNLGVDGPARGARGEGRARCAAASCRKRKPSRGRRSTSIPSLPDAFTTLGVVLSTSGRKADAIDSWKRAVELDPSQFNALYNLWLELAAAGRRDEASALRPPVRRHRPARLLPARHRPHQALPRRGLTPAPRPSDFGAV